MFTFRPLLLPLLIAMLALSAFAQPKKTINYLEITTIDVGARSVTTVSTEEQKPVIHRTTITLNDVPLTLADATVGAGIKIYDFPEGRIMFLGAIAKTITPTTTSVLASTLNASKTLSTGLGTVTQSNGTLATTEQNIVNVFSTTSSATISVAGTAGNGVLGAPIFIDGTSTAADLYLNFGVPTATDIDADATITVSGTVIIYWVLLGDY